MVIKDYLDIITALAAIGALLISILAILRSSTDNKKQIVVGKIEEIYELTMFLYVEYDRLQYLATKLDEIYSMNSTELNHNLEKYRILIQDEVTSPNLSEIFDKTLRLIVLANSYLSKELKMEIIAYSRLFQCVIATIHLTTLERKNKDFKEGFPTTENLHAFLSDLTPKLVEFINLGGERMQSDTYNNYFEIQFKGKLGLKN